MFRRTVEVLEPAFGSAIPSRRSDDSQRGDQDREGETEREREASRVVGECDCVVFSPGIGLGVPLCFLRLSLRVIQRARARLRRG